MIVRRMGNSGRVLMTTTVIMIMIIITIIVIGSVPITNFSIGTPLHVQTSRMIIITTGSGC
jgi:hypothetical protein